MCLRACVNVCLCVCARARACVRACVHARTRFCVYFYVYVCVWGHILDSYTPPSVDWSTLQKQMATSLFGLATDSPHPFTALSQLASTAVFQFRCVFGKAPDLLRSSLQIYLDAYCFFAANRIRPVFGGVLNTDLEHDCIHCRLKRSESF